MNVEWGNGWKIIRGQIYNNENSCRTLIRMSSEAFTRLCEVLQQKYGLQESHNMKVDESVAIFLILCGQNDTQYDISLRFGHAQETIYRKFHCVLGAMVPLAVDYLRPRTAYELEAISNSLEGDRRYWPYFSGCIGTASLNVLGICDHDMLFTYCFVGMAGSTHDSRVLETAIRDDPMFPKPPDRKYYLVDSGYANRRGYLAPYRKEKKDEQVLDLNNTSFEDIIGRLKAYEERIFEDDEAHEDSTKLMYANSEDQKGSQTAITMVIGIIGEVKVAEDDEAGVEEEVTEGETHHQSRVTDVIKLSIMPQTAPIDFLNFRKHKNLLQQVKLKDVIGQVESVCELQTIFVMNKDTTKLEFALRNANDERLPCTLWGKLGEEVCSVCRSAGERSVILVIHFGKINVFKGDRQITSSCQTTKVLIDLNDPDVIVFKNSLPENCGRITFLSTNLNKGFLMVMRFILISFQWSLFQNCEILLRLGNVRSCAPSTRLTQTGRGFIWFALGVEIGQNYNENIFDHQHRHVDYSSLGVDDTKDMYDDVVFPNKYWDSENEYDYEQRFDCSSLDGSSDEENYIMDEAGE
ncbi:uncharacterized protein LOC112087527 [Eutrema salsugineum]|uniref:uncharacterized protein LOC112087527 n=1 Tax=Eutrema salsugineum TaxID=72664 RepID=UPI000CED6DE9|nr:uncharacterized protein LOC112087527 [Eutrema salsugineum]